MVDQLLDGLSKEQDCEARAERFMELVMQEVARKSSDLEVSAVNITRDELEDYLDTKPPEELEGNVVVGVTTTGDNEKRIQEAVRMYDELAAEQNGSRLPNSGRSVESVPRRLKFLGPEREDLPGWTNLAMYIFGNKPPK